MKILFLSHRFFPDIGGIEIISEALASSFVEAGHAVRLITWTQDHGEKEFSFDVVRNPPKIRLLKEFWWADVVFENNPCNRLSWPKFFLKKPMVVGLQTWLAKTDGTIGWVEKLKQKTLNRAQKVIACSGVIRNVCYPDALVIHNPYQEDKFRVIDSIDKTHDFIFVGRLVSDKGANLAITAIQKIVEEFENSGQMCKTSLTIVGDGPERGSLVQLVTDLGIEKYIRFTGALRGHALVECLNEHRFLLVPSLWKEPFGIVALEGMACGCVPIVSNGGGLPEAVGGAGLVFERGNLHSLVEAMQRILTNKTLEIELRNAASEHLIKFQNKLVSQKYLQVLEQAVAVYN